MKKVPDPNPDPAGKKSTDPTGSSTYTAGFDDFSFFNFDYIGYWTKLPFNVQLYYFQFSTIQF